MAIYMEKSVLSLPHHTGHGDASCAHSFDIRQFDSLSEVAYIRIGIYEVNRCKTVCGPRFSGVCRPNAAPYLEPAQAR